MSFDARDFLKGGLIGAVGKKPDYKIKLDAMQWYDKGYLEDSDLAEIQEAIDNQYIEIETPVIEETPIEEEVVIEEETSVVDKE
jgi:hypothetical protein